MIQFRYKIYKLIVYLNNIINSYKKFLKSCEPKYFSIFSFFNIIIKKLQNNKFKTSIILFIKTYLLF